MVCVNAFGKLPNRSDISPEEMKLFQESVSRKESWGFINLGLAYEYGDAVPQDLVEAYAYYSLAVLYAPLNSQNRKAAINNLTLIKKRLSSDACLSGQKRSRELLKEIDDNIAKKAGK